MADTRESQPADPFRISGGEPTRAPGKEPEFRAITTDDWKRSIASARAQGNAALQQIRSAVASRFPNSP